jgi:hypothetical protein
VVSLARAVDRILLTADAAKFQFRHVLTREAVLMSALLRRGAAGAAVASGSGC